MLDIINISTPHNQSINLLVLFVLHTKQTPNKQHEIVYNLLHL